MYYRYNCKHVSKKPIGEKTIQLASNVGKMLKLYLKKRDLLIEMIAALIKKDLYGDNPLDYDQRLHMQETIEKFLKENEIPFTRDHVKGLQGRLP